MLKLQVILSFLKSIQTKLNKTIRAKLSKNEKIFTQTLKISEEVGELTNEILKQSQHQRSEKTLIPANIKHELADIILATILLSIELEIDIEQALIEKMEIIDKRGI